MPGNVAAVSSTFASFDELAGMIRGVDLELIPLRGGPFSGQANALIGDDFVFTAGKFASDHLFRSGTHRSQVLLGMHFGQESRAEYESRPGDRGDLTVHQPRTENFGRVGGIFEYAALSIDANELAAIIADTVSANTLLERNVHMRAAPDIAERACAILERLAPIAFQAANTGSEARVRLLRRSLLYPFLLVAAHAEPKPLRQQRAPKSTIVRRAEAWLDGEPPERLHVVDLCRALGLPLRSVQRAFQETLGMGPAHYVMRYRLHKVRQALLRCDPAVTRVTDVALDHGFWELGRFAGIYRRTYGERPSDTLRRRLGAMAPA